MCFLDIGTEYNRLYQWCLCWSKLNAQSAPFVGNIWHFNTNELRQWLP